MSALPILNIQKNGREVQSHSLDGEVVLGRSEKCGLRLDDRAISRQHALFRSTPEGVEVQRKSDFAPLLVNGVDCTSALLREGDVVQVGPYRLRLAPSAPGAATSAQPAASSPASGLDPDATAMAASVDLMGLGDMPGQGEASESDASEISLDPAGDSAQQDSAGEPLGLGDLELMSNDAGRDQSDFQSVELPASEGDAIDLEADPFPRGEGAGIESAVTHKVVQAGEDEPTLVGDPKKILQVGLVMDPGVANITHLELDKEEISIGRDKSCDVVLNDKKSSRRHAIIVRAGLRFVVKDMASANGIFVNGAPVREQELFHGDKIRIGTSVIEFRAVSPEYARREKNFMQVPQEPSGVSAPVEEMGGASPFDSVPSSQPMGQPVAQPVATSFDPGFAQQAAFGIPGMSPGTMENGLPPPAKLDSKASLVDKFRALPPKRQAIWGVIILGIGYFAFFDEPAPAPVAKKPVAQGSARPTVSASLTPDLAFEALSAEHKKFVVSQHELALTHFKNKEYDKAIFEIQKIFTYVPDYMNSREIERYAVEGKRKLEALEEERRKKALEEKLKAEVEQLVVQAGERMQAKKFDEAQVIFSEILARDPENKQVATWRSDIEAYQAEIAQRAKVEEVRKQVNDYAWSELRAAQALQKRGQWKSSIAAFRKVLEIDAADPGPHQQARAGIARSRAALSELIEPLLQEAKSKEDAGELKAAYDQYVRATRIDADRPEGHQGMKRIRGVLQNRAKETYTEAVLAESYSDFSLARKKYRETMSIAPEDDLYYERAQRKLGRWIGKFGEDAAARDTASDGSSGGGTN